MNPAFSFVCGIKPQLLPQKLLPAPDKKAPHLPSLWRRSASLFHEYQISDDDGDRRAADFLGGPL